MSGLKEHYGNPVLTWGYYPLSEDYNLGGCAGGACGEVGPDMLPIDLSAQARADERQNTMVQRGCNNPIEFQNIPAYTQYVVGTGCYNNECKCKDCHSDCLCDNKGNRVANSGRGLSSYVPLESPLTMHYNDKYLTKW